MKTIVLQARVGSKRYPGKMISDICGKTLLERVLMRLEWLYPQGFGVPGILAIPDTPENDPMEAIAERRRWQVFRGSEDDVLSRYAGAIRKFALTHIIRATGDNPLVHREAFDRIVAALDGHDCARGAGYPVGSGVEAATAAAMLAADAQATEAYDREHVMPYLYKHPEKFSCAVVSAETPSNLSVTVDIKTDLDRARKIFKELGDFPTSKEIERFLL